MAGIYHGHLLEFPLIRVDCFLPAPVDKDKLWQLPCIPSSSTEPITYRPAPPAQLFLLTHTHADHLMGLSSDFTGKIVCSPETKRMLPTLEPERERGLLESGHRESATKRFGGLAPRRMGGHTVDRIVTIPIGGSQVFELGYDKDGKAQRVKITLLDANHCPGSTMFLITSDTKSVLHTGDIRADALFVQSLRREPALQAYLAPPRSRRGTGQVGGGRKVLDRIYLDTAAMIGTSDMPDREPVLQELVETMAMYPDDTIFFLNTWCFGWECVIKEVARYFDEKVHVDRYKHAIYTAVKSDPFLLGCTTIDASASRFHACERFAKCEFCRRFEDGSKTPKYNLDKRIVHVNMVEEKQAGWDLKKGEFVKTLSKAAGGGQKWPFNIDVPIARHSTLPELQAFVSLFRPRAITPNSVASYAKGLDYVQLPDLFGDHLFPGGKDIVIRERDLYLTKTYTEYYLVGLRELQRRGEQMRPEVNRAEMDDYEVPRNDYLPEASGYHGFGREKAQGGNQRTVSSRSAAARDQGARASNFPSGRPEEIFNKIMDAAKAPWLKVESAKAKRRKVEEMRESKTGDETDASQERMEYWGRYDCEMSSPVSEGQEGPLEEAPQETTEQVRAEAVKMEESAEHVQMDEEALAYVKMVEDEARKRQFQREQEMVLAKGGNPLKGVGPEEWPAPYSTAPPGDWTGNPGAVPPVERLGPFQVKTKPESQLPSPPTPTSTPRESSPSRPSIFQPKTEPLSPPKTHRPLASLIIQPKPEPLSPPTTRSPLASHPFNFTAAVPLHHHSHSKSRPLSSSGDPHKRVKRESRSSSSSGTPHKRVKRESCSSQSQSQSQRRTQGRHSTSAEDRERMRRQLVPGVGGPGLLWRDMSVKREE
ncbi:hypothetical protein IAT38_002373 [Cryptococcus sp. DSM 104549]